MQAIIMAGGFGTRLRPLTSHIPKPMVPVLNRPLLEHSIELLKQHGITELIFLLFYLPDFFQNHFGDGSDFGVKIHYIVSRQDFGTAGAAKLAQSMVGDQCLIFSGDALTDIDLSKMIEFHRQREGLMTLALSRQQDPSPFGIAVMDEQQRISRFLEKPSWGQIFSDTVNMGIYVMEARAFDFIPAQQEYFFARDLFPQLLAQKYPLCGYIDRCYWRDIGDLATYQQIHWDILNGKISLELAGKQKKGIRRGKDCKVGRSVRFVGSVVIGDNCRIGDGVVLENVVLGHGCQVGAGSILRQSVLWQGVHVGSDCRINSCVIGQRARIEQSVYIDEKVFIGDRSEVGAKARISANVKIWPDKKVESGAVVHSSIVWGDTWRRELFANSRVSGLANFELSPDFAARLGAAFGSWIGPNRDVIVSRDPTPAARMIYRAIISGLMSAGVHVNDLQVMPIPVVRYTLATNKDRGGVHVRRSPFEQRGADILFFDENGRDFLPQSTKSIQRVFLAEDVEKAAFDQIGDIDYPVRIAQSYIENFLKHIDVRALERRRPKIVLDYSFGSATQVFPSILGALDCEVVSLNAYLDPKKLTRSGDEFEAALKQLARIVKSTHSDAGILIDSGAEKIFCVDERGAVIPSNRLTILLSHLMLEVEGPDRITVPVSVSGLVEIMARERGVELLYAPGDAGSIIKKAVESGSGFACDILGGFIFPNFQACFDGMYSVVKLLELLARSEMTLGGLSLLTPKPALVQALVPCPWESKGAVMRELDRDSQNQRRLLVDGVKIYSEDAWVLVLPDGEKAFYHIIAEAKRRPQAKRLVDLYRQKIEGWIRTPSS